MVNDGGHAKELPGRWHDINWNSILAGQGKAGKIFARPGLIRKDRLALYVPAGSHPDTATPFDTFAGLAAALTELQSGTSSASTQPAGDDEDRNAVKYVLKKAHSSNASGIRFLSAADAEAVQALQRRSAQHGTME
eukprot:TRINITY_DN27062_c0_g1_i1.p1 TRINITY_DN27062_c0_g1~~TRINITY_DN27062_c0_g1_i1.p1  ORF type:complete len:136 (+),score=21.11 TRINITY_DN27062_c0_g1_i1:65-472(+)